MTKFQQILLTVKLRLQARKFKKLAQRVNDERDQIFAKVMVGSISSMHNMLKPNWMPKL